MSRKVGVTVSNLLIQPFLKRPRDQQIIIIKQGKPRPRLRNLHSTMKVMDVSRKAVLKGKVLQETFLFDATYYDKCKWLTGCETRQALFCWHCLLCGSREATWGQNGLKEVYELDSKLIEHEKSAEHLHCTLNLSIILQDFGKELLPPVAPSIDACEKNRDLVRRMIDVIRFTVSEINPNTEFQQRKQKVALDCVNNLQLYCEYDILNICIVRRTIEMLQKTPEIIDHIAGAIVAVVMKSIAEELQQFTYVSMILSEHSRRDRQSQISVVLRYVKNGNICERFVRFYNMQLQKKSADLIDAYINEVIDDFKISKKIIAISLDAALLPNEHLIGVESKVSKKYPNISFVPSHFHNLSHSLLESLSFIKEFDIFFKKLSLMSFCFPKSSKLREQLMKIALAGRNKHKNKDVVTKLELCMSDLTMSAEYFEALRTHRGTFVMFLESILNANRNTLVDSAPELEIRVLCDFLKSLRTFFLLEAMAKFFSIIQPLDESMQNEKMGPLLDKTVVFAVYNSLQKEGKTNSIGGEISFETLWRNIVDLCKDGDATIQCDAGEIDKKSFYNKLYWDIQKCISTQVWYRIRSSQRLAFFGMMNFTQAPYNQLYSLTKLKTTYKKCEFFDFDLLVAEINDLQGKQAFSNCESALQVMDLLFKFDQKSKYPNVYNLSELLSTMPCLSNLDVSPHKFDDIKNWAYTCDLASFEDNFSVMCIEPDYFKLVREDENFYEEVLTRFEERNTDLFKVVVMA